MESISYLWPGLAGGGVIDFYCSFSNPCAADTGPPSADPDAVNAWYVQWAMQNMLNYYKTSFDVIGQAQSDFASSYEGNLYNVFSRGDQNYNYNAVLNPVWDGVKQVFKIMSSYQKEIYEAGETVTLKAVGDLFPVVDAIKDIITSLSGPSVVMPAQIPNAEFSAQFSDMILQQRNTTEQAFLSIVNSDPNDPITGILTVLKAKPDAFIGVVHTYGDQTVTDMTAQYLHSLSVAWVNAYYSSIGQVFMYINDADDWDNDDDCDGDGSFNYPICLRGDDAYIGGFGLGVAPYPNPGGNQDIGSYKDTESAQFVYLNDATFTQAPYNFNAQDALVGSLKCQLSRSAAGTFNSDFWKSTNGDIQEERRDYDVDLYSMDMQGVTDKGAGIMLYSSSLDPDDDCFWAIPVIDNLYSIYSVLGYYGSDEVEMLVDNYEYYIKGWMGL